jgi:hypothetical protein
LFRSIAGFGVSQQLWFSSCAVVESESRARLMSVWLWVLAAGFVEAAPSLKLLRPLGAQRGTTFTLTLVGQELTAGAELITTLPATITRLAPRDLKTPETELPFLVELRADTPVALYPVRIKTRGGISNLVLFSVSDFPEIEIKKAEADPDTKENIRVSPRWSSAAR